MSRFPSRYRGSEYFKLFSAKPKFKYKNINSNKNKKLYAPFLLTQSSTIDSLIKVMTLDEKLGQLLFVETDISKNSDLLNLSNLVKEKKISGILSISNDVGLTYLNAVDSLQKEAIVPLLFGLSPNNTKISMPTHNLSAIIEDSVKRQIIERNQARYSNYQYDIAFEIDLRTITQQDTSLQNSSFTGAGQRGVALGRRMMFI